MKAGSSTGPLAKADGRKGANLVIAIDPLRKLAAAEGAQNLPQPFDNLLKAAELMDVVEFSVSSSDLAIDGFLRTKNVDSADQLLGLGSRVEREKAAPPAGDRFEHMSRALPVEKVGIGNGVLVGTC